MYLLIYLIALYENVLKVLTFSTVIIIIATVPLVLVTVFYVAIKYDNGEEVAWEYLYRRTLKIYCWVLSSIFALHIFLPAPVYLYTMTGIYVGEQVLDNPKVNALIEKSVKTLELKLDKTLQELNEVDLQNK